MTTTIFCPNDFILQGDDDHLRVDGLCRELLLTFYHNLVASGVPEAKATTLAGSADYFVRDFLVDNRQVTPFAVSPELIRQFAATWYIINTVDPTVAEIAGHLAGILAFSRYLYENGYLSADKLSAIDADCTNVDYLVKRIDSFWNMPKDGYQAWEAEYTLK